MPKQKLLPISEAARSLGVSLDTLRRWDKAGKIKTRRDASNRRVVAQAEIDRLRGEPVATSLSARNRFRGRVVEVKIEGLLAQVEIIASEPSRIVAVITREAAEQLSLEAGMDVTALVKSTSVMVER